MFAPDGREVLATGVDNLRKAITREETAGGSLRGTVSIPKVVGAPVSKQDKLRGRNSI